MLLRSPRKRSRLKQCHCSNTSAKDWWNRCVFRRWQKIDKEADDWMSGGREFQRIDAATGNERRPTVGSCCYVMILPTLIARLKARCLGVECSAGMRVKNADRCWVISGEVRTVLSRWVLDAGFVWDCRADAITDNTLATQSGFTNNWSSSNASGKPLTYRPTSRPLTYYFS